MSVSVTQEVEFFKVPIDLGHELFIAHVNHVFRESPETIEKAMQE